MNPNGEERAGDRFIMTVTAPNPGYWTASAIVPQGNLRYTVDLRMEEDRLTTRGLHIRWCHLHNRRVETREQSHKPEFDPCRKSPVVLRTLRVTDFPREVRPRATARHGWPGRANVAR